MAVGLAFRRSSSDPESTPGKQTVRPCFSSAGPYSLDAKARESYSYTAAKARRGPRAPRAQKKSPADVPGEDSPSGRRANSGTSAQEKHLGDTHEATRVAAPSPALVVR